MIGVEVAFAVRISAYATLASGVALLMVLALAKLRGVGLGRLKKALAAPRSPRPCFLIYV